MKLKDVKKIEGGFLWTERNHYVETAIAQWLEELSKKGGFSKIEVKLRVQGHTSQTVTHVLEVDKTKEEILTWEPE